MTDDQHGEGTPQGGGQGGGSRWDPLPQGDYDDGATAFVQLPEGGIDALLDAVGSPLAAPGHGFVPPQITVAPAAGTDPAGTGTWPMPSAPVDGTQWQAPEPGQQPSYGGPDAAQQYGSPDPAQVYGAARQDPYGTAGHGQYGGGAPYGGHDPHPGQDDRFAYQPGATSQWDFGEAVAEETAGPAPGHDVTGQWSIPVAGGDLPDESGEFTTSSLVEQWGGTPPATLPGGAPAPWATQAAGAPWGARAGEPETDFGPEYGGSDARADFGSEYGAQGVQEAAPEAGAETVQGGGPAAEPRSFPDEQGFADEQRYQEQQRYAEEQQRYSDGRRFAQEQPGPEERTYPQGQEFPDVRPYLRPAAEAGGEPAAGPVADETVTDEAQGAHGAQEAAEGPADPPEAPAPADEAQAGPEAAEEPVAPVAPVREAPSPEPATDPDAQDATEAETEADAGTGAEAEAGTEAATEAEATAGAEPEPAPESAPVPDTAPESESEHGPQDPAPEEPVDSADPAARHEEHPLASYVLRVNGTDRPVTDAWIGESLLYVLRERLGLAGAKDGCSQGECGACNVQVDGRLVASCLVPAVTAAGSEVRTVEGLAADGQPSDVQRALARCGAVQCGFCVPGMAMTMHDLLEGNPAPTELETRQALCGNLCRCSGYRGFLRAVDEVVAEREASAEADADADAAEARIPHQAGPGAGGVNPSAFDPQGSSGPHPREPHDHPHDHPHGQDDGGQA
ncbi:2Fe-2S iron-sulfur cluster-binding protein [Streptomyces sp. JW3]|uniref:2Fe-2S iron-sulfur cluster-binding protein n=1 Tax=Streptomyces sp. JW3 TaxID=3456955 RepID=UPI003FA43015